MKKCFRCKLTKDLSNFYLNGKGTYCKPCHIMYMKKWKIENQDSKIVADRRYRLYKRYGITPEQYETMFKNQHGACAICKGQNLDGTRLSTDHCHKTGKVRGLLCDPCNRALGFFKDDYRLLVKASEYLEGINSISRIGQ